MLLQAHFSSPLSSDKGIRKINLGFYGVKMEWHQKIGLHFSGHFRKICALDQNMKLNMIFNKSYTKS